jgi:hypothetical protein
MKRFPVNQERIFCFETEYGIFPTPKTISFRDFADAYPPNLTTAKDNRGMTEIGRLFPDDRGNFVFASPELLSVRGLLATYVAAEEVIADMTERAYGVKTFAIKRSIDAANQSRGDTESYHIRADYTQKQIYQLITHLATRPVLTGCGGFLIPKHGNPEYIIDQRAAVVNNILSSSVSGYDAENKGFFKYSPFSTLSLMQEDLIGKRLQVASGSHNLYAYPVAARIFNTSAVLRLIEHDQYPASLVAEDPLTAANDTARLGNSAVIEMMNGKTYHPAEVQYELLDQAQRLELPAEEDTIAELSATIAADISGGQEYKWVDYLEYAGKKEIIANQAENRGIPFNSFYSAKLDIEWHIVDKHGSLDTFHVENRGAMMPDRDSIDDAKSFPIDKTRAHRRSMAHLMATERGTSMTKSWWSHWQAEDQPETTYCPDPRTA